MWHSHTPSISSPCPTIPNSTRRVVVGSSSALPASRLPWALRGYASIGIQISPFPCQMAALAHLPFSHAFPLSLVLGRRWQRRRRASPLWEARAEGRRDVGTSKASSHQPHRFDLLALRIYSVCVCACVLSSLFLILEVMRQVPKW